MVGRCRGVFIGVILDGLRLRLTETGGLFTWQPLAIGRHRALQAVGLRLALGRLRRFPYGPLGLQPGPAEPHNAAERRHRGLELGLRGALARRDAAGVAGHPCDRPHHVRYVVDHWHRAAPGARVEQRHAMEFVGGLPLAATIDGDDGRGHTRHRPHVVVPRAIGRVRSEAIFEPRRARGCITSGPGRGGWVHREHQLEGRRRAATKLRDIPRVGTMDHHDSCPGGSAAQLHQPRTSVVSADRLHPHLHRFSCSFVHDRRCCLLPGAHAVLEPSQVADLLRHWDLLHYCRHRHVRLQDGELCSGSRRGRETRQVRERTGARGMNLVL
mmetsp:Transcript_17961/g.49848  ORF Transcript_17961/g.49848 Transcript_17961/m.49848 type:complete len:327 (+) Transcript_17961:383-1363(+)